MPHVDDAFPGAVRHQSIRFVGGTFHALATHECYIGAYQIAATAFGDCLDHTEVESQSFVLPQIVEEVADISSPLDRLLAGGKRYGVLGIEPRTKFVKFAGVEQYGEPHTDGLNGFLIGLTDVRLLRRIARCNDS